MTEDEIKKFRQAVFGLDNAYSQLTNFKSRGKRATAEAVRRAKEENKNFPAMKKIAKDLERLMKSVGPSVKAYKAIQKIANDAKTLPKTTLADAKKSVKDLLPSFEKTDALAEDCLVDLQAFFKQLGLRSTGADVDFSAMMKTYIPDYVHQYAQFKVKVNKL